jgi:hypothetical protein
MGYAFMFLSAPYFLSCALLPPLFKKVPAKLQFVIGFIISMFGMAFMGPTKILHLPDDKIWPVLVGMFLVGTSVSFIFVSGIPESI